jgi:hypothetical protein
MFTTCNGRFLIHSLVVSLLVVAAGSASFGGEVKKLIRDDGKKLPPGKTRPAVKLHPDDTVVVRLNQRPGLGHRWVESSDSTKLLELESRKEVKSEKSAPKAKSNTPRVVDSGVDLLLTFKVKANAAPTDKPQYLRLKLVRGRSTEAIDTFEVPIQVIK